MRRGAAETLRKLAGLTESSQVSIPSWHLAAGLSCAVPTLDRLLRFIKTESTQSKHAKAFYHEQTIEVFIAALADTDIAVRTPSGLPWQRRTQVGRLTCWVGRLTRWVGRTGSRRAAADPAGDQEPQAPAHDAGPARAQDGEGAAGDERPHAAARPLRAVRLSYLALGTGRSTSL